MKRLALRMLASVVIWVAVAAGTLSVLHAAPAAKALRIVYGDTEMMRVFPGAYTQQTFDMDGFRYTVSVTSQPAPHAAPRPGTVDPGALLPPVPRYGRYVCHDGGTPSGPDRWCIDGKPAEVADP